jgi:predicted nucleic acid-binding protein
VILIATSAWIEFLRNTGSPVCNRVDELLDREVAVCDPDRMELLAGARDEHAIRSGIPVIHSDSDFDAISRNTPLIVG